VHFTPTSASWLNQVERFFAQITTQRIGHGTFDTVDALETAIAGYPAHHNQHGKPFFLDGHRRCDSGQGHAILRTNFRDAPLV
jgi:hypothetical protein